MRVPAIDGRRKGAVLVFAALACCVGAAGADEGVRRPAVAGTFYPGDPVRLSRAIDSLLSGARPARGGAGAPLAIVAPHAGYDYSGRIAADAFSQARRQDYDLVVILAPNHTRAGFDGFAVLPGHGIETPLGVARLDAAAAAALRSAEASVVEDADVHAREHAIEVQVPFVQRLWPRASILAVVVGTEDPARCARFGRALAGVVRGRQALLVASSDLSHYPTAAVAQRVDARTLDAIASLDVDAFEMIAREVMAAHEPALVTAACGHGPISAVLTAARALGATRATIVSYANSSDTAGDPSRVVGYGAVVIDRERTPRSAPAPESGPATTATSPREQRALLALARSSIERTLATGTFPPPRDGASGRECEAGVFVTLRKRGTLRGCVGTLRGDQPLGALVSRMAVAAATKDPRFPPVSEPELQDITIEISLVTLPRPVDSPEQVAVGTDGVVLGKNGHEAVFLPEVATEQGWNRDQLLDHLCEKAGLPTDCWHTGAALSTFRAEVFAERR